MVFSTTLLTGNPFDIGSIILWLAPSADDYMKELIYMGYLPQEKAKDAVQAVNVFEFEGVLAAYTQAKEEKGFRNGKRLQP